jgi:uncharacterized protein YndB with AHSA1/START domain
MAARSSITAVLDGAPDMVFRTITDIARLPEWNAAMTKDSFERGQGPKRSWTVTPRG